MIMKTNNAKGESYLNTAQTAGFRMLPSYYESISALPDKERLELYDAIMNLGFGNETGELSAIASCIFHLIEPSLKKSVRYFEKQRENGSKPKKTREQPETPEAEAEAQSEKARQSQNEAKAKRDSESESDSESEGDSESESAYIDSAAPASSPQRAASKRFVPPSREEIAAYCAQRGSSLSPDEFADYYAARGWRLGNGPMRDWRAAVRTWERREKHGTGNGSHVAGGAEPAARDFGVRYDTLDERR